MFKSNKPLLSGALACLTLFLTACGGGSPAPEETKPPASTNEPAKQEGTNEAEPLENITLEFWTIALQPTFNDYFNELIAAYEAEHPNVKIDWQDYPFDAVQTKLLATAAGGGAPDVVNLNTEIANQMASKGALADLKQYVSEEAQAAYFEGIFNSTVMDGKAYALPWYTATQVLFMNKTMVEQAGLDPANPPKTREELHQWARTIKEKTGAAGYATEFLARHLASEGIPILNEDRTAAAFNTPEAAAVLQEMKQLIDEGIVMKESAKFDQQVQYYASEQVAFALTGSTFINRIKTAAPDIYNNTVAVPLPPGKGNISFSNSMNIVVPLGSSHPQEAADFAAFLTNADNQLAFSKVANTLPSTKSSIEDPFFTESDNTLEAQAKLASVAGLKIADEYSLGVPSVQDINTAIARGMQRMFLDGSDIQTTLDETAEEVNGLLKAAQ